MTSPLRLRLPLLAALFGWPGVAVHAQVPLPADLHITTPAADVPSAIAAFVGAWGNGAWGGVTPVALAVTQVAPDGSAQVVYAFGNSPAGIKAAWQRLPASIRDGVLTVQRPTGTAEFHLTDDGMLFQGASAILLAIVPGYG